MARTPFRLEKLRTHHGRQGEGHDGGDEDGHSEGDRKFAKQAADHISHEQQWNENGDEGDG